MPYSDRYKVVFIHIPKTGRSSIEKALKLVPSDTWGTLDHFSGPNVEYFDNSQHLTFQQIKSDRPEWLKNAETILVAVRDPTDRIYSHFIARKGQWLDKNRSYSSHRFILFIFLTVPLVKLCITLFGKYTRFIYPQYEHIIPQHVYLDGLFKYSQSAPKKLLFISLFASTHGDAIKIVHSEIDSSIQIPHLRNSHSSSKVSQLRTRWTDRFIRYLYRSDYLLMHKISHLINKAPV